MNVFLEGGIAPVIVAPKLNVKRTSCLWETFLAVNVVYLPESVCSEICIEYNQA